MNIAQAKQIDLPSLLSRLGVRENIQASRQGQWFFSPFRNEDTASFKVWQQDSGLWCWKDFGTGEGGNIIAFANRMIGRDASDRAISDALKWLETSNGVRVSDTPWKTPTRSNTGQPATIQEERFTLIDNKKLYNPQLCNYIQDRGIPPKLAQLHCGQANYFDNVAKKKFFGISFPNIDGGLEIRAATQYKHHVNTGPKTISFIPGQDKTVQGVDVFEGFTDFLSYLVLTNQDKPRHAAIVLNSVSFARKAAHYIVQSQQLQERQTKSVFTFFDKDFAGQKAYEDMYEILEPQGYNVGDCSHIYEGRHDLNDYLQNTPAAERIKFGNAPVKFYDTSATSELRRAQDQQRENVFKPKL